jgi:lysophospholipase L1-like esterase
MWSWARAWPRRLQEKVNVVCIGSSTMFGVGALAAEYSIPGRLGYMLRGTDRSNSLIGSSAGGIHYRSADSGWTTSGTINDLVVDMGLALKDLQLNAWMSRSCVADGFEWQYLEGTNYGSHSMQIDALTAQNLSVSQVGSVRITGQATSFPNQTIARGVHTFKITSTSGRTPFLGIYATDGDQVAGLRTYNGAYPGGTSAAFASGAWYWHTARLAELQPAAVVFMVGANDYSGNVDPAVYEANIRLALRYMRLVTNGPLSVLLVHSYRRYDVLTPTYAWSLYGDALRRIALDTPDTDFLDVSGHFPASYADDWEALVGTDQVHPTPRGHGLIASLICDHMMRAATPRTPPPTPAPSQPTDPSTWSGLVSAWRASDLSALADNANVATWPAYAGSGQVALAHGTTDRRPLFKKNSLTFNRQHCVEFNGYGQLVDDALICTFGARINPPATVVVVAKLRATFGSMFSSYSAAGTVHLSLALNAELQMQAQAGSASAPYIAVGVTGRGAWRCYVMRFQSAASALFVSGLAKQDMSALDTTHANAGLLGLTLAGGPAGATAFNGQEVAEAMVFNRGLTDQECNDLLTYMGRKYHFDGAGRTSV